MADVQDNAQQLNRIIQLLEVMTERERPPEYLRLKAAAHYCSIGVWALRLAAQRGDVDIIKVSDGTRVPWIFARSDLDAFMQKRKTNLG